jgi:carotenoid 1,2-hydratase
VSDDADLAVVVIAMVGNPFSPAYWWRRRRGATDPLGYSAMNVAIYGRGTSAFSLYERPIRASDRSTSGIGIGRSVMAWHGDDLVIDLEERTTPLGFPIRGRIVVRPEAAPSTVVQLDPGRLHQWWPVAPLCRIEVELTQPSLRFRGHGYHDANAGSVPLEATFSEWSWSRSRAGDSALLTYDVQVGSGPSLGHAYRIGRRGDFDVIDGLEKVDLGRSFWGLRRSARADRGASVGIRRSLEDGPFYSRALIDSTLAGRQVVAMHEHLSGERLTKGWVRYLTRHRMRSE